MKKKILLAMSGGVDSSIAAIELKNKGYEVVGVTFIMFDDDENNFRDFINETQILAQKLDVKHYVVDVKKEFDSTIINYFVNSYINGQTPNPCVLCNPTIKFKTLIDFADKLGIDKVATGHYSIVKKNKKNNRYFLSKPADDWKNQTYFLWDLPQEYLKRLILPLSNLKKDKVKKIAVKNNFVQLAEKKESYDVCFLAGTNYRDFVDEKVKQMKIDIPKGDFITEDGTVVGKHNGIAHYTIGQRKGLGFAMGIPYYVKNIDKEKNQIIVAPKENLSKNQLTIKDINSVKYLQIPENKKFLTKIRYRDKGKMATVEFKENTAFVTFEEPVFGITPGQSAVFYENNDLVGGGIIV